MNLEQLADYTPQQLAEIPDEEFLRLAEEALQARAAIQQHEQLYFYEPASPDAKKIHLSTAKKVLATGGNRSSKTESMLVDALICMTGIVPKSLEDCYPRGKIRCPMRVRLMVNSLTNTWEPTIKPKLQWNKWSGREPIGGKNGHWGWIPPRLLIRGKWDESWEAGKRTLTLTCGCTMQVMSYENEVEDLSGGSYHLILNDEGSPHAHWRENEMRTVDVAGRLLMAMTPPDDESASWDAAWIYDDLYEKGQPGPAKDPDIDSFTLFTEENRILDLAEVAKVMKDLTPEQKEVRTKGRFLHLSGRIYPLYSNRPQWYCHGCNKLALVAEKKCSTCGGDNVVTICHFIEPFPQAYEWPCVFILDPHPRKDYMMAWFAVSPSDDYYQVAELLSNKPELADIKKEIDDFEKDLGLNVAKRLIDPNMAESPAHNAGRREITVRRELDDVGLRCDLAIDSFIIGYKRVNALLKPDLRTRAPRLQVFNTCRKTDYQMMRYVWDEWSRYSSDEKDAKQTPRAKNDDFPTIIKYLANAEPTYSGLRHGGQVMRRAANGRRSGY